MVNGGFWSVCAKKVIGLRIILIFSYRGVMIQRKWKELFWKRIEVNWRDRITVWRNGVDFIICYLPYDGNNRNNCLEMQDKFYFRLNSIIRKKLRIELAGYVKTADVRHLSAWKLVLYWKGIDSYDGCDTTLAFMEKAIMFLHCSNFSCGIWNFCCERASYL